MEGLRGEIGCGKRKKDGVREEGREMRGLVRLIWKSD